jgi:DNA-binding IclR family transcriptional regulator
MSNTGSTEVRAAVQSVDRALVILGLLARDGELGLAQIADELGVHKSTAFRIVATMERHQVVEQGPVRGRYRLGMGVIRLAGATTLRLDLVQETRAVMLPLATEVGETVNIVVLSGHEALYLDQVAGPSALQLHNWVGQRIPLHATSNGKVLLAHLPLEQRRALLSPVLTAYTARTVTDHRTLEAELADVRRRGYAVAIDELEEGLTAVAAPIVAADGSVAASLSASGPTFRMPAARIPAVADQVMSAAERASRRMGWHARAVPVVAEAQPAAVNTG